MLNCLKVRKYLDFKIIFYLLGLADTSFPIFNFLFHFILQHLLLLPIEFLQVITEKTFLPPGWGCGANDYSLFLECCFNKEETFSNKFKNSGHSVSSLRTLMIVSSRVSISEGWTSSSVLRELFRCSRLLWQLESFCRASALSSI